MAPSLTNAVTVSDKAQAVRDLVWNGGDAGVAAVVDSAEKDRLMAYAPPPANLLGLYDPAANELWHECLNRPAESDLLRNDPGKSDVGPPSPHTYAKWHLSSPPDAVRDLLLIRLENGDYLFVVEGADAVRHSALRCEMEGNVPRRWVNEWLLDDRLAELLRQRDAQ